MKPIERNDQLFVTRTIDVGGLATVTRDVQYSYLFLHVQKVKNPPRIAGVDCTFLWLTVYTVESTDNRTDMMWTGSSQTASAGAAAAAVAADAADSDKCWSWQSLMTDGLAGVRANCTVSKLLSTFANEDHSQTAGTRSGEIAVLFPMSVGRPSTHTAGGSGFRWTSNRRITRRRHTSPVIANEIDARVRTKRRCSLQAVRGRFNVSNRNQRFEWIFYEKATESDVYIQRGTLRSPVWNSNPSSSNIWISVKYE